MADEGDGNYWILQLPWHGMVVGEDRRRIQRLVAGQQIEVETRQDIATLRNTVTFDVPIPTSGHTWQFPTGETVLGPMADLLKLRNNAKRNCNRTRFAGFPPFGLRFLGLRPNTANTWRFAWLNPRRPNGRFAPCKHAEDVVPGGYLRLFYQPDYAAQWREDWQNYEVYAPCVELFDNV